MHHIAWTIAVAMTEGAIPRALPVSLLCCWLLSLLSHWSLVSCRRISVKSALKASNPLYSICQDLRRVLNYCIPRKLRPYVVYDYLVSFYRGIKTFFMGIKDFESVNNRVTTLWQPVFKYFANPQWALLAMGRGFCELRSQLHRIKINLYAFYEMLVTTAVKLRFENKNVIQKASGDL